MGYVPNNLPREIKNVFNSIRKELSRKLYLKLEPNKEDCPNCLTSATGDSLDKFDSSFVTPVEIFGNIISPSSFSRGRCPVCYGKGYLEQENIVCIRGLVLWNPIGEDSRGDLQRTPVGIEGYNIVQVKADKCYYESLRDCVGAVIDGVDCELQVPPTLRNVGPVEITAVAYFITTDVGHTVR